MDIAEVRRDIERSHVPASRVGSGALRPASSSGDGVVFQHVPDTDQVPSRAPDDEATAGLYRRSVEIAFALFSSTRLLTYLPTMFVIYASADASQYSMLTWLAWVGSNASMALWLFENNGRRFDKAVVVSIGNALMCLATCALIAVYRV